MVYLTDNNFSPDSDDASTQVVKASVTTSNNNPSQNYTHPDN